MPGGSRFRPIRALERPLPMRLSSGCKTQEVRRVHEPLGKVVLRDEGRRHDSRLRRMAEDAREDGTSWRLLTECAIHESLEDVKSETR